MLDDKTRFGGKIIGLARHLHPVVNPLYNNGLWKAKADLVLSYPHRYQFQFCRSRSHNRYLRI